MTHAHADQTTAPATPAAGHDHGQQHPLAVYLKVWGLLFVLSVASYLVDLYQLQGLLRWFLITVLMLLKAGLIVAVFMHMMWERLVLVYVATVPPLLLLVLLAIGAFEADHTRQVRAQFFEPAAEATAIEPQ